MNYIMSINKLPAIKSYWECGQFSDDGSIKNVMARSRFGDILRNLHFSHNTKGGKSGKGNKVRPPISQSLSHLAMMILKALTSIW